MPRPDTGQARGGGDPGSMDTGVMASSSCFAVPVHSWRPCMNAMSACATGDASIAAITPSVRFSLDNALHAACAEVGIVDRDVPADGRWHKTDIDGDPQGRGDGHKLFPDGEGASGLRLRGPGGYPVPERPGRPGCHTPVL
jgi:hypothetical protein